MSEMPERVQKICDGAHIHGEPLLYVNSMPDREYAIRILRAHRQNANMRYSSTGTLNEQEERHPLLVALNSDQRERAAWLDVAIEILERELPAKVIS